MKSVIPILIILVLMAIGGYFYCIKESAPADFKNMIDSLNFAIKVLENEKSILKVELKKSKEKADSVNIKIASEKIKIIKTIEYRDKENIIIKSMPDGELFQLFTKFDSLSHKGR